MYPIREGKATWLFSMVSVLPRRSITDSSRLVDEDADAVADAVVDCVDDILFVTKFCIVVCVRT